MYSVETYENKRIRRGVYMPVISVELGPASAEVKSELIRELTKTAAEITKIPEPTFVVLIKEYQTDAIGVGGVPLSERV